MKLMKFKIDAFYVKKLIKFIPINAFLLMIAFLSVSESYSQENGTNLNDNAVRVFLDITRQYEEYVKTEIPFVNYVRDRKQAQVHIMMTSQRTGSGGNEYTFTFNGLFDCSALNDTLVYISNQNDSEEESRIGIVRILKMGLIRYVNRTPLSEFISIDYLRKDDELSEQAEVVDKWDYWVFNLNTNDRINGEESRKTYNLRGSISADRVTPYWKSSFSFNANYERQEFSDDDGKDIFKTKSRDFQGLVVKSINDHWSTGFYLSTDSSDRENIKSSYNISPALEYNVFPYAESTRREFRFLYKAGFTDINYNEETIFFKTREQLLNESLSATYEIKERWGSVRSTLEGSHYFHDFDKNMLDFNVNISVNLFEGFSIDLTGQVSRINDQLSLKKGDLTEEEIYLNLSEQATSYEFSTSIGLRYSFGSIYSNVVNPRFGNNQRRGGGGGGPGGFR